MKITIVTCRQSAQRINYYNALGAICELTVVSERRIPDEIIQDYNVKPQNYDMIDMKGIPMFGYMAFCPGIIEILKKRKSDIIIIEQYATPSSVMAINYMYNHKIPFIISADSGFAEKNEKKIKYNFKRSLISKASFWITGGKQSVDYLAHYGADPTRTKIFKFSPYSKKDQPDHPTTLEEKEELRKKLGIYEEKIIVSAGQQIHRKGFDVLLRAFADIRTSENTVGLYILGGNPNEECQTVIDEIGNANIHFPGKVSKEKLKEYYKASDIFAFPTRYDVWGYPVNEAMSFGLPVVTTYQCNAGLELINEGINGYLVESGDSITLGDKISKILENDDLRIRMGENNYIKSKEYNSETMAESVYRILTEDYLIK